MANVIKKGLSALNRSVDRHANRQWADRSLKSKVKLSLPKSPSGRKSVARQDNIVNKAVTAIRNHFRPNGGA